MQARQYSPTEGRFLGQDVFASAGADLQLQTDPLTQNRYVFAGGNPVSRIEWDGHMCGYHGAECDPKEVRKREKEIGKLGYGPQANRDWADGGGSSGGGTPPDPVQQIKEEVEERVDMTDARVQNVENAVDTASEMHLDCTGDDCDEDELARVRLMVWLDLATADDGEEFDEISIHIARRGTPTGLATKVSKGELAFEGATMLCGSAKFGCQAVGRVGLKALGKLFGIGGKAADDLPTGVGQGPYAGESIPARGTARDFTPGERSAIDDIGSRTGCHSCGTRNPGTKSGHFVPDHQPPSSLLFGSHSQQLYPHCIFCSREQGLAIARMRKQG